MINGEPIDFEKESERRRIFDLIYLEDIRFGIAPIDASLDKALNDMEIRKERLSERAERLLKIKEKDLLRYNMIRNGLIEPTERWLGHRKDIEVWDI